MQAGELRHRIKIVRPSTALNTFGRDAATLPVEKLVWAKFEYLNGSELEQARQVYDRAQARVTIRYDKALTTRKKFEIDGKTWSIGAINNEGLVDRYQVCIVGNATT